MPFLIEEHGVTGHADDCILEFVAARVLLWRWCYISPKIFAFALVSMSLPTGSNFFAACRTDRELAPSPHFPIFCYPSGGVTDMIAWRCIRALTARFAGWRGGSGVPMIVAVMTNTNFVNVSRYRPDSAPPFTCFVVAFACRAAPRLLVAHRFTFWPLRSILWKVRSKSEASAQVIALFHVGASAVGKRANHHFLITSS